MAHPYNHIVRKFSFSFLLLKEREGETESSADIHDLPWVNSQPAGSSGDDPQGVGCGSGRETQGGGIWIQKADPHCCTAETNQTKATTFQ